MTRHGWAAPAIAGAAVATLIAAVEPASATATRPLPCLGRQRDQLQVIGLTSDSRLVCFRDDRPGRSWNLGRIKGLGDEPLVGIDYRVPFTDAAGVANGVPASGTLYALGRKGGVYAIEVVTNTATKKAQLDVALEGDSFGVDFNPTVDRLRIVSDTGQNLRANVDTGATLRDGALNNAGTTATGVTAVAYTNNDTDPATATTLYDIDTRADQLSIQNPPNAGTLAPVGSLTVDAGAVAGFDLYSATVSSGAVRTTVDVRGLAVLGVGGKTSLHRIVPFSGRAVRVGAIGPNVVDLAIPLDQ